ncbi:TIGR03752 family integrating conjugative element protein [Salmonella enterica subsp. enterica serovar Weybridge]|nr:TIGR03752 family integrating conjugative element protein [Salmonella enterica subsp. enterica serovar Weybridge]EBV0502895.1 TIGR03752 family integrating conjugative element protein [Salmonella enterica subsp. enterica serovar Teddington]ECG3145781.1 TIGR03752 family integrating conjugative element protein [Salmonella enterica subsp. enterica serovar Weybridge]ECI4030198.1 TIGR03752 family integrating conjugative element protein [Salmonella enterica subsp. enterica]
MQIKSNTLLKIIVPVVLLSAVVIGVKSCGGSKPAQDSADSTTVADLTQEELRILGIEGDTPQDTLRTLVGRIKTIQTNQANLEKQNATLAEENARLQNKGNNVDGRINDAVNAVKQENTQAQQKLQAEQQRLAGLLESLKNTVPGPGAGSSTPAGSDLPVGLGLEDADPGETVAQGTVWIEPQDGVQLDRNGKPVTGAAAATNGTGTFQFPTAFGGLNDNEITRQKAELDRAAKNQQSIEETDLPVYTLPENSTLVGSQAMTALLGRVPIDGTVIDPYPFKVLIGKENLTANGIELPDVEGAVVSGTATGDWVLSCVRGEVHSITFVFTDGTVRTVPQSAKSSDGSNGKSSGGSIGWLSDEHGIPCLSGDRKTNAATYLPTLFALSAAGAASDAMSESQTTTTTDGTSITSTLTGSAGQAALGKALSGGTNELAEWVKARYGQMFDAIYVPPGANVAVHITRQIPIDYEEKGRKVKYDFDISQQHELD